MRDMKLSDLKRIIDTIYEEVVNGYRTDGVNNPDEVDVLITTEDLSIGRRGNVGIKAINLGFDWETGELRIEPVVPIKRVNPIISP